MNNYQKLEEEVFKKEAKKKKKMRVSGKSVLKLQEIIRDRGLSKSYDKDKS